MGNVKKSKKKNVKKKDNKLTEKEKLFCQIYVKNFNSTTAVIKSGYNCKNRNIASVIGYELLNKTLVAKEIAKLKKQKAKSIMLGIDDIVERYMHIAFADMTDFVEWGQEEITEGVDEEGKSVTRMVNFIKFKESNMVDGGLVCQIKQGRDGASIKLADSLKALEWLAGYFEANPMDRHKKEFDNKKLEIERKKTETTKQDTVIQIVSNIPRPLQEDEDEDNETDS